MPSKPAPKYVFAPSARGEKGRRAVGYDLFQVHDLVWVDGEPMWRLTYLGWGVTRASLVRQIWHLEGRATEGLHAQYGPPMAQEGGGVAD